MAVDTAKSYPVRTALSGPAAGVIAAQAIAEAARDSGLRIIGPNSLGVIVPELGLNASQAVALPRKGHLAFISQSHSLSNAILDWAADAGVGFSLFASLGNNMDAGYGDLIDYLGTDPNTRAIILYVQSIRHARRFMSAARAASRMKPVIVVKAARSEVGLKRPATSNVRAGRWVSAAASSSSFCCAASSSAAWLQTAPWSGAGGVRERGLVAGGDPLDPLFALAPLTYREVVDFDGFALEHRPRVNYLCMTPYDQAMDLPVLFTPEMPRNGLAEIFANEGIRNLRTAEIAVRSPTRAVEPLETRPLGSPPRARGSGCGPSSGAARGRGRRRVG